MKLSVPLVLLPFAQCSLRGLLNSLRSLSIGARYGAHQILAERDVLLDTKPQKFHNGPVFSRHNHSGDASWLDPSGDTGNSAPEEILVEEIHTEPENVPIAPIDTNHLLQPGHVKPPQDSSVVLPLTTRFPPIILRPLTPGREKLVLGLDRTILDENIVLDYFTEKIIREFVQERLKMHEPSSRWYVKDLIRYHGSILKGLSKENRPELIGYEEYLNEKLAYGRSRYHRNLRALLKRVETDVILFTWFSGEHAQKVLEDHGLLSYFHMIIATDPENPYCPVKPSPKAFERVSEALMVAPNFIYYLDDNCSHMKEAHRFGWSNTKFPEYYKQLLRNNLFRVYEIGEMSRLFKVMFPPSPITHFRLPPTPDRPKLLFTLDSLARDGGGIDFFYERAKWKFVNEYLGISEEHASSFAQELHRKHGSVTKGLAAVYGVEPAIYEEFLINNAKYERIYRDEDVVRLLKDVDADIFVVTDVSKRYAEKVLEGLGILPLVREIFISHHEDPEFNDKPPSEIFDRMEAELGVDPSSIYFVCRKTSYLKATLNLGWNVARIAERYDDGSFDGPPLLFKQDQDSIYQLRGTFKSLFVSRKECTVIE